MGIMMITMMIPMMTMMILVDNDEESLKWLCGESGEVLFFAYL